MEPNTSLPAPPGNPNVKPALTITLLFIKAGIVVGIIVLAKTAKPLGGSDYTIGALIVTLFILFLLSFVASAILTYTVRRKLLSPPPGSLLETLVRFWEKLVPPYDVTPILDEPVEPITDADIQDENWVKEFTPADVDEMLTFILNRKGGGRKSDVPDEIRYRVVRDWILMQMRGTSVRLQDFLDERFGYHADGSPKVPRDTFYGWHKRFKKMLIEYKSIKRF